jgi:PAS domain S-box-containing protein
MTRLPESEFDLEILVRERTDEIAQYLAAIVDSSDDAIISIDLQGTITSWNKSAERLFGYTFSETVGKPITMLIPLDRQGEERAILERINRGERTDHYETVRQRKDGGPIEISLTVSPVRNAKGEIIGASKIARDITERKRREAQVLILAREAEHRAKNMLSIVLATVQLSHADTVHQLKRAIEGRIQSLSKLAELFAETRWKGADLHTLVTQELSPFCHQGMTPCRIEGPSLMLEPSTAQALAMTIHELVTNAAKYGALSAPDGRLHVEWSVTENNQVALQWIETGGPQVEPSTREGFGTQLMKAMIGSQLQGRIIFDWRGEGLACKIIVPT